MTPSETHAIERTSPKGELFVGTCLLCGEEGLTMADVHKPCRNPGNDGRSLEPAGPRDTAAIESPSEPARFRFAAARGETVEQVLARWEAQVAWLREQAFGPDGRDARLCRDEHISALEQSIADLRAALRSTAPSGATTDELDVGDLVREFEEATIESYRGLHRKDPTERYRKVRANLIAVIRTARATYRTPASAHRETPALHEECEGYVLCCCGDHLRPLREARAIEGWAFGGHGRWSVHKLDGAIVAAGSVQPERVTLTFHDSDPIPEGRRE